MSWMFPVIGKSTWSGGSWMPGTLTHRGRTHAAIDIYAARGQAIVSPTAGYVKASGSGGVGGNWIQIEGRDGNVYYFAHMAEPTTLERGQQVGGGMTIGAVGNTGSAKSTSPHVHFSVKRNGVAVNPVSMLQSGVVVPDTSISFTGEAGGSSPPWAADPGYDRIFGDTQDEPLPADAQQDTPAWYDQLAAARLEAQAGPPAPDPVKFKASEMMRGTLNNMANMVRSAGFDTGNGSDTGIDEGPNEITREAGPR